MAITTHAQLLTAVSDYIGKRTDLGSVDDDFVVLAENRLNYGVDDNELSSPPLRVRQMQERAIATATGEYVALPDDFLEINYIKTTSTSPHMLLKAMPAASFDLRLDNTQGGHPIFYAIVGGEFRLYPTPSSSDLEILYYQKIPALASTDPNWLLTANPAIYLYGTLLEAAIYIDENADIVKYHRLFTALVRAMNQSGVDSSLAQPMTVRNEVILPQSSVVRI